MSHNEVLQQRTLQPPRGTPHVNSLTEHTVDRQRRLVMVKFKNRLTLREIERYSVLLRSNPSFHSSFSEIVDLTEVEEIDLDADDFLKLADEIDPFSTEAKRAFVARTSIQNHAARMHKVLRAQRNIEIFHTLEDAERWVLM